MSGSGGTGGVAGRPPGDALLHDFLLDALGLATIENPDATLTAVFASCVGPDGRNLYGFPSCFWLFVFADLGTPDPEDDFGVVYENPDVPQRWGVIEAGYEGRLTGAANELEPVNNVGVMPNSDEIMAVYAALGGNCATAGSAEITIVPIQASNPGDPNSTDYLYVVGGIARGMWSIDDQGAIGGPFAGGTSCP